MMEETAASGLFALFGLNSIRVQCWLFRFQLMLYKYIFGYNIFQRAHWLFLFHPLPFFLSPPQPLDSWFDVHQLRHSKGRDRPDPHLCAWLPSGGKSRPVILCYCAARRVNKSCGRLQRTLTGVVLADSAAMMLRFQFILTASLQKTCFFRQITFFFFINDEKSKALNFFSVNVKTTANDKQVWHFLISNDLSLSLIPSHYLSLTYSVSLSLSDTHKRVKTVFGQPLNFTQSRESFNMFNKIQ